MPYIPPFELSSKAVAGLARIERLLGQLSASSVSRPAPELRRRNRIRTIRDSLAIEGNTLSLEQVTAIFDNKRVVGPKREIVEVRNAVRAYEICSRWNPKSEPDFKKAHGVLMQGLVARSGAYRSGAVGVMKGDQVSHMAPPPSQVSRLMGQLFAFCREQATKLSPLVYSAIMHYEIEFIHPFEDGNGRMGRLWHHLILSKYHPAFETAPFQSLIREHQKEYYRVLEKCDRSGDSTAFIEFSLGLLVEAVESLVSESPRRRMAPEERLEIAQAEFKSTWFSRKQYLKLFPSVSAPTASRDLAWAAGTGMLAKKGNVNQTVYRFL